MVLGSVGSAVNWLLLQNREVSPPGNVGSEGKLLLEQLRFLRLVKYPIPVRLDILQPETLRAVVVATSELLIYPLLK